MQIYQCDRCGLVVRDYHDMGKVGWRPYTRSSFEEAFDNDGNQRYGEFEVCKDCLSEFKAWLGVEEPFEVE